MSLREPSGDQYIEDMFRLLLRDDVVVPDFIIKCLGGGHFHPLPIFVMNVWCKSYVAANQPRARIVIVAP